MVSKNDVTSVIFLLEEEALFCQNWKKMINWQILLWIRVANVNVCICLIYLKREDSRCISFEVLDLCAAKGFFFYSPKGKKKPSPQWKKGISAWAYVKSQYVLMKLTRMWGCFGTKFQVLFCLFCKQLVLLFKQKTFDVVGFQHSQKVIFVLLDWHAPTPCLPSSWLGEGLVKPTRQTILQIFSCPAFTIR